MGTIKPVTLAVKNNEDGSVSPVSMLISQSNSECLWEKGTGENSVQQKGTESLAQGDSSLAEGDNTITTNPYEHAEGHFNKSNFTSDEYPNEGNTLHSVGIGSSENDRKNAVEIMQNGDMFVIGVGGYDGTNAVPSESEEDPNYADTLQSSINDCIVGVVVDGQTVVSDRVASIDLTGKVDVEIGKGLSTNDFTTTLKNKLDLIENEAQVNVQSDWNETDNTKDSYIKNKPSIDVKDVLVDGETVVDHFTKKANITTDLLQKKEDNDLETLSKVVVGAINENKQRIDFIENSPEVSAIVQCYDRGTDETKTDIVHFNKETISVGSYVKVVFDETHDDKSTYYKLISEEGVKSFEFEAEDRTLTVDNITIEKNGAGSVSIKNEGVTFNKISTDAVSTEIGDTASETKLVTEKAVKDYADTKQEKVLTLESDAYETLYSYSVPKLTNMQVYQAYQQYINGDSATIIDLNSSVSMLVNNASERNEINISTIWEGLMILTYRQSSDNPEDYALTTGVLIRDFKDSGAIGEIKTAPYVLPNFIVCDGTTEYAKTGEYEELYNVYSTKCPSMLLEGNDEDHFKLIDLRNRYIKMSDTDVGSLGSESLPNIKGTLSSWGKDAQGRQVSVLNCSSQGVNGAFGQVNRSGSCGWGNGGSSSPWGSGCQFNAGWSSAVYKDNAKVNPDHIIMYPLVRYKVDKVAVVKDNTSGVIVWDGNITFELNDFCSYEGKIYKSLTNENINHNPTDKNYWSESGGNLSIEIVDSYPETLKDKTYYLKKKAAENSSILINREPASASSIIYYKHTQSGFTFNFDIDTGLYSIHREGLFNATIPIGLFTKNWFDNGPLKSQFTQVSLQSECDILCYGNDSGDATANNLFTPQEIPYSNLPNEYYYRIKDEYRNDFILDWTENKITDVNSGKTYSFSDKDNYSQTLQDFVGDLLIVMGDDYSYIEPCAKSQADMIIYTKSLLAPAEGTNNTYYGIHLMDNSIVYIEDGIVQEDGRVFSIYKKPVIDDSILTPEEKNESPASVKFVNDKLDEVTLRLQQLETLYQKLSNGGGQ